MNLWCFRGEKAAVKIIYYAYATTVALLILHPLHRAIMYNMMQCHCVNFYYKHKLRLIKYVDTKDAEPC